MVSRWTQGIESWDVVHYEGSIPFDNIFVQFTTCLKDVSWNEKKGIPKVENGEIVGVVAYIRAVSIIETDTPLRKIFGLEYTLSLYAPDSCKYKELYGEDSAKVISPLVGQALITNFVHHYSLEIERQKVSKSGLKPILVDPIRVLLFIYELPSSWIPKARRTLERNESRFTKSDDNMGCFRRMKSGLESLTQLQSHLQKNLTSSTVDRIWKLKFQDAWNEAGGLFPSLYIDMLESQECMLQIIGLLISVYLMGKDIPVGDPPYSGPLTILQRSPRAFELSQQ